MNYVRFAFYLCVGSFFCGSVLAATPSPEDCEKASGGWIFTACNKAEFDKQDLKLNTFYKKINEKLSPEEREEFKKVEKLWLSYRNQECDFETKGEEGGSMYNGLVYFCYERMTKARIENLKWIAGDSGIKIP